MRNPSDFYEEQLNFYQTESQRLSTQLTLISWSRLIIFVVTAVLIYFTFHIWQLATVIGILGLTVFIFLLHKHTQQKSKLELHQALTSINKEELLISEGTYHHRPTGSEFLDPTHVYSLDIDLFGRGSFFQYINRTAIKEGAQLLAKMLSDNNVNSIEQRQQCIRELSINQNWQQHFAATASLIKVETPAKIIVEWLSTYKSELPKMSSWLPLIFSIISLSLLALSLFEIIDIAYFGYWVFVGLAITGAYLKKINSLTNHTNKIKDTFKQYAALLDKIENSTFESELLKHQQTRIDLESEKASKIFYKFSKQLDALDNRNNLISALLGNGYFLVDLKNAYKVEQWIQTYGHKVSDWFDVVTFFDVYNSLGVFAFNHQNYVYPTIKHDKATIKAEQLGHPLINAEKRIDSDVTINNQQFFIVTGANMAGKSTFLRTISLHIVMANVGLPVCAKSSIYAPVKLITSMRTSDSLTDDSSYFFSELTRLKFIVDHIQEEPYFIILDEILKGTNSTDKAIGSKKFVEKLVAGNATGIIATHDLSLCEISKELEDVENYYFDAEIVDDELYFDYKLKKGVCQNMNASFLLKKMQIV